MTDARFTIDCTWESIEACQAFANRVAKAIEVPITIRLDGTLGTGKTQFTKYFAESLGANIDDITSPTFVLIHRYATSPLIYHVDAYRVGDEDEFLELGVEELFEEPAITIVEWGEKFRDVLPKDHLAIAIEIDTDRARKVRITGSGPRSNAIMARMRGSA